ncbi:hypothetical protein BDY24DRAFT_368394 [Mrakia frigida]|uniref:uncharacterized protein n=1 Tax=Mrakia frigida TaxID=29902 RepID=UPI003FCC1B58
MAWVRIPSSSLLLSRARTTFYRLSNESVLVRSSSNTCRRVWLRPSLPSVRLRPAPCTSGMNGAYLVPYSRAFESKRDFVADSSTALPSFRSITSITATGAEILTDPKMPRHKKK